MKLYDAIARADILRPNTIDMDIKASWVYELEGEIAEMMNVDVPPNPFPLKPNEEYPELLMPFPKDNIYHLYLCAMIDNANEETMLYMNDMEVFNNALMDAKAWYRRNNRAKPVGNVSVFSRRREVKENEITEDTESVTVETEQDD